MGTVKINFETNGYGGSVTGCQYKKGIMVGSIRCQDCDFNKLYNKKHFYVICNRVNDKGKVLKINFKVGSNGVCKTPCVIRPPIMVGSLKCKKCCCNKGTFEESKKVMCSAHEETGIKPPKKTFVIDIDDTLIFSEKVYCAECGRVTYKMTATHEGEIALLHDLFEQGHTIILHTGRNWDCYDLTVEQLAQAGINYHQLVMGKPQGIYVDKDSCKSVREAMEQ